MTAHLDDFTLLCHVTKDLGARQTAAARAHLKDCGACAEALASVRGIDEGLRGLASAGDFPVHAVFEADDPFRRRPAHVRRVRPARPASPAAEALRASRNAAALGDAIVAAATGAEGAGTALSGLSLDSAEHRFGLLYALQAAGRQSAESPIRFRELARTAIDWLRRQPAGEADGLAEACVPRLTLRGQAHMLHALASLWTDEFSRARAHLVVAYRSFARASADETGLAVVEVIESQRRSLEGRKGETALVLARRARETFEAQGMEDNAARARVAEGLASAGLGRRESALASYRAALPVFERLGLWSNYVGALNSTATCLNELGRSDEARREYARALRRFESQEHRFWLGYLRIGFAEVLFAAGRFGEAAASASRAGRVFMDAGQRPQSLIALLLEVESWARHGAVDRARARLEDFWTEIETDQALDPSVQRGLAAALSGTNPDYKALSTLRAQIGGLLTRHYGTNRA